MLLLWFPVLLSLVSANPQQYAPIDSICPRQDAIERVANGTISNEESMWMQQRDQVAKQSLITWLANSDLQEFDPQSYLQLIHKQGQSNIRIGMAFSGGGFRAMLSGAGMISALDNRNPAAMAKGGMGGLLQSTSYMSGLSGGSWLVGSVAMSDWQPVPSLQANPKLWNFNNPFNPTVDRRFFRSFEPDWDLNMMMAVQQKNNAGYHTSVTDIWGRMLSAQMFSGTDSGVDLHWSDLMYYPSMKQHAMPFPLITTDSIHGYAQNVTVNNITTTLNSTVFEFSPLEFGSWDPSVGAFIKTRYLGTEMKDGMPNTPECTLGFDNIGFIIGASSTLFNEMVAGIMKTAGPLNQLLAMIINFLGGPQNISLAPISPNPFADEEAAAPNIQQAPSLSLVDGGEDGLNVPFAPLLQPSRGIDVILAMDNSADTPTNWPNGSSLWKTYQRQFLPQGNTSSFPEVPSPDTFASLGLATKPSFFGCNAANTSSIWGAPPVVVYMPNSQHSFPSNQSTMKLTYTNPDRDAMIQNGMDIVTQNNGRIDPQWRSCVACAILLREQQRRGDQPTQQCQQCFSDYCFN